MKKKIAKVALLLSFVGLATTQTGAAVASVDWSWSFDTSELTVPQDAAGIQIYATVSNLSLSTESLVVQSVHLGDGSMGPLGQLFDSQGGGVLTAFVQPWGLSTPQFLAPGESVTGLLFYLNTVGPLTLGEQYFAAPNFYIGTNCSSIYSCASSESALPTSPLHITVASVPEPSVNIMLVLGLLAVAIRARKHKQGIMKIV